MDRHPVFRRLLRPHRGRRGGGEVGLRGHGLSLGRDVFGVGGYGRGGDRPLAKSHKSLILLYFFFRVILDHLLGKVKLHVFATHSLGIEMRYFTKSGELQTIILQTTAQSTNRMCR